MIVSLTLFVGLILLAVLGYPLAFAIAIPSAVITFFLDVPIVTLITMMFSGVDSFPLMAVPFFVMPWTALLTLPKVSDTPRPMPLKKSVMADILVFRDRFLR